MLRHQGAQQLFFGHVVFGGRIGIGRAHQKRHAVFFGLVHFDLALMALDRAFAQVIGRQGLLRDLSLVISAPVEI